MTKWRFLSVIFFIFIVPLVFLPNALTAGSGATATWQDEYPDNAGQYVIMSDYSDAVFTVHGNAVDNKSRNADSHAITGRDELPCQGESGESESVQMQAHENYGKLPLFFIQNDGQMDERVKFYEKGSGHAMFFTKDGVHILLTPAKPRIRPYETGTDEPEYTQQQHSFPQAGVNGEETGAKINTMQPLHPDTDKRSLSQLTTHNS